MAAALLAWPTPTFAQWVNQPWQGIPRASDGTPNLAAPAPRATDGKPDLSGLWRMPLHPAYLANIAADLDPADVLPWAAKLFEERINDLSKDDPAIGCLPMGPRHITRGSPFPPRQ